MRARAPLPKPGGAGGAGAFRGPQVLSKWTETWALTLSRTGSQGEWAWTFHFLRVGLDFVVVFFFPHRGLNAGLPWFFFQESPCAVAKSQETPPPLQGHTCAGGQRCVTGPLPVGVRGCGAWEGGSGVWIRPAMGGGQSDHLAHATRCWFSVPRPARPSPPGWWWLGREVISLVLCRWRCPPLPPPVRAHGRPKLGDRLAAMAGPIWGWGSGMGRGGLLWWPREFFLRGGWVGCGFNASLT